ncbi:helix-turn-helix transcriptional regulator [Streptomyces sp. NPDC002722]|uniref:helix-turn-helix transcriptional regulator n=1 Tax=unclassified Streptomyces TaxID=2593676 RepID=UPI00331C9CD7
MEGASETSYGFDAVKFRAARTAAGASVAGIARAVGVSERAVSFYLAGARTPRPGILPGLAAAVGTAPADLCTVEHETLAHLRIYTGRTRAEMASVLGMGEETYQHLETTGEHGRLARARYDDHEGRWIAWQEWAAPCSLPPPNAWTSPKSTPANSIASNVNAAGSAYAWPTPNAPPASRNSAGQDEPCGSGDPVGDPRQRQVLTMTRAAAAFQGIG